MRIEIICTGDEVLSGKTINTNFSHMSRRLQEVGLPVTWETTVGDDHETLIEAFRLAAGRADYVIVNGGLGPTVDDLSQVVAAEAAGVELGLREEWLERIQAFYRARGREMPPNNRKQAMLPETAELIDNPIGTACGFALDIGKARFFFTPGVPREVRRMVDEQIIPRLLERSGMRSVVRLKRFHSFGLGESRVDDRLTGVEALAPDAAVKLGFQAHFPQLETKLMVRAADMETALRTLEPIEAEIRVRLGNYILCEDDDTLEGVILQRLEALGGAVAVAEVGTYGGVASRLAEADAGRAIFRRGTSAGTVAELAAALGTAPAGETGAIASELAERARMAAGVSHGLAVATDAGAEQSAEANVFIAIASTDGAVRRSAYIVGGAERTRVGGIEMALDSLRRHLHGLPVREAIDFERA